MDIEQEYMSLLESQLHKTNTTVFPRRMPLYEGVLFGISMSVHGPRSTWERSCMITGWPQPNQWVCGEWEGEIKMVLM